MKRLLIPLALLAAPALAQNQPAILPPETAVVSPGGVDVEIPNAEHAVEIISDVPNPLPEAEEPCSPSKPCDKNPL